MIWSAVKELGIVWLLCRVLYSVKLILLKKFPVAESLFEHKVNIKRIDILPDTTVRKEQFIKRLPDNVKKEIITAADLAAEGKIKGFSSIELSYGNPINWQLNPLTGIACNVKDKWYRIPDFDRDRGDIKAVWEISRFSHFIGFARAYLATNDRKYYESFSRQLSDWLSENPYSYGANYKCGQECALRMMNALLAYAVFNSKGVANKDDERNIAELIKRCYQKILSNFFYAHRCIKNNHTISELVGMIIGAWCSCDDKRLQKAYKMLDKVIAEQFSADGGYKQLSFNYQRLALQDLEYALCISGKTGINLSENSVSLIKNSVELFYQCQDDTGDVPNYGFNDGALVFPVSSAEYRDFRPIIGSLYAMLFNERIYNEGIYDEEYLWFGGNQTLESFERVDTERKQSAFPEAGLFTMRSKDSWMMAVLNDYKTRPSHMDQLHIDLWVDGVNVLCDCGTYSYADKKGEALALTGAHNTVKIDGIEQMTKKGTFLILNRTERCSFNMSDNEFSGEMKSKNGYTHSRRVTRVNDGYIVCDRLTAHYDKNFELLLHTPCEVRCEDGLIKLYNDEKHLLTVKGSLDFEIRKGIRSVRYLSEEPVTLICFKGKISDGKAESLMNFNIIEESDSKAGI